MADAANKTDFVREAVAADLASGRFEKPVVTRFPPEPNGFLHVGHAKAICIDFGVARDFDGETNLRFDDTNPTKEEQAYIDAIREDVAWLGFTPDRECYASDYFGQLYEWAQQLIQQGDAYVDEQPVEVIRETRGNVNTPGSASPYRDRPADESLGLFERMKNGEFPDGAKVLRAKIDMASPNMNLRDPVMYRILHATHPRTGGTWCIYPMYDFAHGQSDSLERITHSLCSLEFEDHRPLYDWFIEKLGIFPSRQIEFSRLEFTYVMTSKRKLKALIDEGVVNGWDDPRLPTLRGMRRRGFSPEGIKACVEEVGVTKFKGRTEIELFEHHQRHVLNKAALRRMAVLDPVKLVITNWADEHGGDAAAVEMMDVVNNPEDESAGTRQVPFSGELLIERNDFMVDPPKKFFRLGPGREVRLRYGFFVTCTGYETDDAGNVTEVHATYDPATRGGDSPDGRKVKGTLHWVSAAHAADAELRVYDRLFVTPDPDQQAEGAPDGADPKEFWRANLNPDALTKQKIKIEPALREAVPGEPLQFERHAYVTADVDHAPDRPVFNRTLGLRDSWKSKK
ncbi:MAG: glutamine--tRNA ligase/YqeY domain fusion protein [Planctomycetota bacterium]